MRPIVLTAGPYSAGSTTVLAASQAPTSGTALTLASTVLDTPRRILLTFGNDAVVTRTFALIGVGWAGNAVSETLTIPTGAGTAVSVLDYKTLTSATPGGTGWSANVSLGTSATGVNTPMGSSAWARCDDYGFANVALNSDVTGTVNYTVESSDDDPNVVAPQTIVAPSAMTWITHPSLDGATLALHDGYTYTPRWVRLTVNSGTAATASATLTVTQPGGRLG